MRLHLRNKGHGRHTFFLLVGLLSVCNRISILILRDVFGLAILDSLALALVGGGGLVAVLSHDECVAGSQRYSGDRVGAGRIDVSRRGEKVGKEVGKVLG